MAREPELGRLVTRLNTELDRAIEEINMQLDSPPPEGPNDDAAGDVAIWT
jgi:hypothetical protein